MATRLKLSDESCLWCRGPVVGLHADSRLCGSACRRQRARWLRLQGLMRMGAGEELLERVWRSIDRAQARIEAA